MYIKSFFLFFLMANLRCTWDDEPKEAIEIPAEEPIVVTTPKKEESPEEKCNKVLKEQPNAKPFLLSELKDRFLKSHNLIRQHYGLKDFVWDEDIAQYAQSWADHLKNHKGCDMHHRAGSFKAKKYGENLGRSWTNAKLSLKEYSHTPEAIVLDWSKECKDYNYNDTSCKAKHCGHFTQVVWKDSQKIGCGVATCQGEDRKEIWVCNYSPHGNIIQYDHLGNKTVLKPF